MDETQSESTAPAEVAAEASVETAEATTEAPQSSQDIWDAPLNLTVQEETEAPPEDAEKPAEVAPAAPEVNETAEEEETEEESDKEILEAAPDRPAPLSRRKLREVEDSVITPLRDPDAPIDTVWKGLVDINPQRATELHQMLVQESATKHPDEWLQFITGIDGITVESLKSRIEPTQASDATQEAIKKLDEFYGESWKDASRDDELLDEDRPYAQYIREQLMKGEQATSEKDAEIKRLTDELNSLKPEIEGIKTQQQQEFEIREKAAKETAVKEYTSSIEKRSLPDLFEQAGLKTSESDTPAIKGTKEFVQSLFKTSDEFMSPFEQFAVTQFSGKEALGQIIGRVDKFLDEATKAEVKAARTADKGKAAEFERIAAARREDAKQEQARLVVLHKKAAGEFLQSIPIMSILEENADLQRRLALRQEIVGTTAVAANTQSFKDQINESSDPWNAVSIVDRAASLSR